MSDAAAIPVPARLLKAVGVALYGPSWQVPLARRLQVPVRRVQRWAAAAAADVAYPVPCALLEQLLADLERHVFATQRTFEDLKAVYDAEVS